MLTYFAFVGIAGFGINSFVVFHILERLVHESTVTSIVTIFAAAVDQVLLAQRHQFAGFAEVLAFQSTGLNDTDSRRGYSSTIS